jgi:hypothetical protein
MLRLPLESGLGRQWFPLRSHMARRLAHGDTTRTTHMLARLTDITDPVGLWAASLLVQVPGMAGVGMDTTDTGGTVTAIIRTPRLIAAHTDIALGMAPDTEVRLRGLTVAPHTVAGTWRPVADSMAASLVAGSMVEAASMVEADIGKTASAIWMGI